MLLHAFAFKDRLGRDGRQQQLHLLLNCVWKTAAEAKASRDRDCLKNKCIPCVIRVVTILNIWLQIPN